MVKKLRDLHHSIGTYMSKSKAFLIHHIFNWSISLQDYKSEL